MEIPNVPNLIYIRQFSVSVLMNSFKISTTTLTLIPDSANMLGSKFFPALWSLGFYLSAATSQSECPVADVSVIAHDGESIGEEVVHNDGT